MSHQTQEFPALPDDPIMRAVEDDCITMCQEMIRIPSVNFGEGKGDEKAMAEYVADRLRESAFPVN